MSIYDKLGAKTAGVKARAIEKTGDKVLKSGPGLHLDATTRMHAAEQRAEELEELLKASASGKPLKIRTSEIIEVPGRKRMLKPEEYDELRENLRENDLVTPIVVRLRSGGGYELVSGHNRLQAFNDLGRDEIPAIVKDADGAQADLDAFYANLLHPNLSDYQKFLGFRMIRSKRPGLSVDGIAQMTGKSKRNIEQLLSFEALPVEVHEILQAGTVDLGSNAADDLVKLVEQGKTANVIEAVKKLASGEMNQKQAVAFAAKVEHKRPERRESISIRKGNAVFCKLTVATKTVRIDFPTAEIAAGAEAAVRAFLVELSKS